MHEDLLAEFKRMEGKSTEELKHIRAEAIKEAERLCGDTKGKWGIS